MSLRRKQSKGPTICYILVGLLVAGNLSPGQLIRKCGSLQQLLSFSSSFILCSKALYSSFSPPPTSSLWADGKSRRLSGVSGRATEESVD